MFLFDLSISRILHEWAVGDQEILFIYFEVRTVTTEFRILDNFEPFPKQNTVMPHRLATCSAFQNYMAGSYKVWNDRLQRVMHKASSVT